MWHSHYEFDLIDTAHSKYKLLISTANLFAHTQILINNSHIWGINYLLCLENYNIHNGKTFHVGCSFLKHNKNRIEFVENKSCVYIHGFPLFLLFSKFSQSIKKSTENTFGLPKYKLNQIFYQKAPLMLKVEEFFLLQKLVSSDA